MAKCPVCESEIIETKPWLRCSECGAELHLKISKTGRVKKIVVHSFNSNGSKCPYCHTDLIEGDNSVLNCPVCGRVFINPNELVDEQVKRLSGVFELESVGDELLRLDLKS